MDSLYCDDVIVGGGSAGCVLAHRLSGDPTRRVLLIEAGRDYPPGTEPAEILDSYPMPLFFGDHYIWPGLEAQASRARDGRAVSRPYEQGRVIGGGSSINVQSANRGLPRDYDEWRDLGARGWGWNDVLPYFRKLETDLDFGGEQHGSDGPIPIRRILQPDWPSFGQAVAEAFATASLPFRADQNADFADGIFPPAFSNRNDRRVSAAMAYLDAATRRRANLAIWSDSRVHALVMDGPRAAAVRGTRGGVPFVVKAQRVVVTAGAIHSPAVLMRSGIGPAALLQRLGVAVAVERRGVGGNLRDHPSLTFCQYLPRRLRLPMRHRRANFVAVRYSSGLAGCEPSDMYITASARAGWHALGARLGLYFLWCNRPYSSGRINLVSSDPNTYPAVDLNLLDDPRDLARLVDAVRWLAGIVVHPKLNSAAADFFPASFSPLIKRLSHFGHWNGLVTAVLGLFLDTPAALRHALVQALLLGGIDFRAILLDDGKLEAFVRRNVFGVWHPAGTCRLGDPQDPDMVVDAEGKVIGTTNVYVADASVMPRLPSANTNIPTLMIAEKISAALATGRP